jgi:hypothetical protein
MSRQITSFFNEIEPQKAELHLASMGMTSEEANRIDTSLDELLSSSYLGQFKTKIAKKTTYRFVGDQIADYSVDPKSILTAPTLPNASRHFDLIKALNSLQLIIEKLGGSMSDIRNKISGIESRLATIERVLTPQESKPIVVFFTNQRQFIDDVFAYLDAHHVDYEMRGGGVIITNETEIDALRRAGFNFVTATSIKELRCKYNAEMQSYGQQIEDWICRHQPKTTT